jgi:tyrosinase
MKFSSLAAVSALVGQSVHAYSIPEFEDAAAEIKKRQSSVVPTTGPPGTSIYPRLEIRQMQSSQPDQFTLLILGLQAFQALAQDNATGYYQIAGIHGVPRVDYNGVGQCSSCGGTDGYCTHDSVLFPAWHRVYVALFEQQFLAVVNQVADSFPDANRTRMQQAASTMKWPYWDWAAPPASGSPCLPESVSGRTITITGPSGPKTLNNPLFRHYFPDTSGLYYSPFVDWKYTLRYPNSDDASASSVEQNCTGAFDNIRPSIQDQVYQLFSTCSDYLHFSNDDAGSSSTSCSNSLEGIHNTIHTTAGGPGSSSTSGGHMTYLSLAGFDPIFFLHHCNVDRLFAMWQSQWPDAYGASQVAPHSTWTIAQGSTQDADSPLEPFYKDTNGSFWTTNEVRNWNTTFHYTYPEFSDSDGSQGAIANYINKLYGPSASATAGSSKRTAAPESGTAHVQGRQILAGLLAENGSLYQYVANIKTPRYALNGSYQVFLFNGAPQTEEPSTWIHDPNLIGPMGVFAQPDMMDHNTIAGGSIPLTRTLSKIVGSGLLGSLLETLVAPFLAENLQWRVAANNGTAVDPGTIPGFELAVFASTASQPGDNELPVWSEFMPLMEVTQNKAGGSNTTGQALST